MSAAGGGAPGPKDSPGGAAAGQDAPGGASPAAATAAKPAGTPAAIPSKDPAWESKMADLLRLENKAQDTERKGLAALKQAADREAALAPIAALQDRVAKGELVDVAVALYGDKLTEDVLMELAGRLAAGKSPKDPAVVFKELREAEKAEEKRVADEKKESDTAREAAEEKAELETYMASAAEFLVANAEKFPLCDALGADSDRYQALAVQLLEKNGSVPAPDDVYQLLEAEHEAKINAKPAARAKLAARAKAEADEPKITFSPIVPRASVVTSFESVEDEERAKLRAYDKERAERRAMGK